MFNRIKSLFTKEKTPPPEFHDAELGVLTAESGLWSGTVTRDGFTIPFSVAGTQAAPSSGLLDQGAGVASQIVNATIAPGRGIKKSEVFLKNWPEFPSLYRKVYSLTASRPPVSSAVNLWLLNIEIELWQ